MSQVIIYKNDEGGVSVIHPTPQIVDEYGIEVIAEKDVPVGKHYLIIDASSLPDRALRTQWDMDETGIFIRQ